MPNRADHVKMYDHEKNKWVNMHFSLRRGKISIYYPEASEVLSIDIKKGIFFKRASIEIVPAKKRSFKAFRNWLRASFSMPILCSEKDVVVNENEHSIRFDIGFPFEYPVFIKFIQKDARNIFDIVNTWMKSDK